MSDPQPTVRDLLAHPALVECRLLGGAAGLDRPVRSVVVASRVDQAALRPGAAVVVVARDGASTLDADVALRHAADQEAALVVVDDRITGLSAGRIADRLALPTVAYGDLDAHAVARSLDAVVRAPRLARAESVLAAGRAVRTARADPARAVRGLAAMLQTPVRIVDAAGAELTGSEPPVLPSGLLDDEPRTLPVAGDEKSLLVAAPITLVAAPEAWIVAGPLQAGPARIGATRAALEVAAAALTGGFAARRLALERDVRFRAGLLAELLTVAGPPSPQLSERLVAAGWRTAGWHVGVHLRPAEADAAAIEAATQRVEGLLAGHGLAGPVVQGPGGWSAWVTTEAEPDANAYRDVVRAVRALVHQVAPRLPLHAGVGAAHAGIAGLAATVNEARSACALAGAAGTRPAVEHTGEAGGRRLLLGSFGSDAFRSYAEAMLAPLVDAADRDLLPTLEAYLEHESSAASTAAALGVHRNTVAHRIRRAEELLGVSLALPDERLTLQLACRVVRLQRGG
jgi:PucR-like helix-turn-helix protein/diguanylate cyclase with GGDEF domain